MGRILKIMRRIFFKKTTATPEVVHAPVVQLATLVDHPATSLLVLTYVQVGDLFVVELLQPEIRLGVKNCHLSVADNLLLGDVSTERDWLPTN